MWKVLEIRAVLILCGLTPTFPAAKFYGWEVFIQGASISAEVFPCCISQVLDTPVIFFFPSTPASGCTTL
jgi:hypothetical protein